MQLKLLKVNSAAPARVFPGVALPLPTAPWAQRWLVGSSLGLRSQPRFQRVFSILRQHHGGAELLYSASILCPFVAIFMPLVTAPPAPSPVTQRAVVCHQGQPGFVRLLPQAGPSAEPAGIGDRYGVAVTAQTSQKQLRSGQAQTSPTTPRCWVSKSADKGKAPVQWAAAALGAWGTLTTSGSQEVPADLPLQHTELSPALAGSKGSLMPVPMGRDTGTKHQGRL